MTPDPLMSRLSETCPFEARPGMAGKSHFFPFEMRGERLIGRQVTGCATQPVNVGYVGDPKHP